MQIGAWARTRSPRWWRAGSQSGPWPPGNVRSLTLAQPPANVHRHTLPDGGIATELVTRPPAAVHTASGKPGEDGIRPHGQQVGQRNTRQPPRRSQSGPQPWGAISDAYPGRVATPGKGYSPAGQRHAEFTAYIPRNGRAGASARRGLPGVRAELARRRATRRRQFSRGSGSVSGLSIRFGFVEYQDRPLNRLTSLPVYFVIIPILIVLGTVSGGTWQSTGSHSTMTYGSAAAASCCSSARCSMILFGESPRWWFDWNLELQRFGNRVENLCRPDE